MYNFSIFQNVFWPEDLACLDVRCNRIIVIQPSLSHEVKLSRYEFESQPADHLLWTHFLSLCPITGSPSSGGREVSRPWRKGVTREKKERSTSTLLSTPSPLTGPATLKCQTLMRIAACVISHFTPLIISKLWTQSRKIREASLRGFQ